MCQDLMYDTSCMKLLENTVRLGYGPDSIPASNKSNNRIASKTSPQL